MDARSYTMVFYPKGTIFEVKKDVHLPDEASQFAGQKGTLINDTEAQADAPTLRLRFGTVQHLDCVRSFKPEEIKLSF
jgi:hypothetical protein